MLGWLLFPILVALVIPYLMTGLLGAGAIIGSLTAGALPEVFTSTGGGIPASLSGLVISSAVLGYVFMGGLRAAVWANTLQTCIFITTCLIAFGLIAHALGGAEAAGHAVLQNHPEKLIRGEAVSPLYFLTYFFIPLSAGMASTSTRSMSTASALSWASIPMATQTSSSWGATRPHSSSI